MRLVHAHVAAQRADLPRRRSGRYATGPDGLAAIVRSRWKVDLYGGHLFVFLGRRADRCKILFWDRGGFVLYYKRLERGRFRLPLVSCEATSVAMDATQLAMLLDGIDVVSVKRLRRWEPPAISVAAPA